MYHVEQSSYQFEHPMTQPGQPSGNQSSSVSSHHTESGGLSSIDTEYVSSDTSVKQFDKPLKCNICSELMGSPKSVESHRDLHFVDGGSHRCVVCSHVTRSRFTIKIHIRRRHTGVKPFCCLICHKSFAAKGRLSYHILSNHSGQNG
eukprot:11925_1